VQKVEPESYHPLSIEDTLRGIHVASNSVSGVQNSAEGGLREKGVQDIDAKE